MTKNFGRLKRLFITLLILGFLLNAGSVCYADPPIKTVRVGVFELKGFFEFGADRNLTGYGYDYLQEMKKHVNWTYDYYFGSYNQCLQMLAEGKIDLMGSLQRTPERDVAFDFSAAESGFSTGILTTLESNVTYAYEDFRHFDGMRVAALRGNSRNQFFIDFARQRGFSCELVYFDSESDMRDALLSRRVDAIVSSNIRKLEYEKIIAKFNPDKFFFATTKGNKTVLTALNYAQERIKINDPYYDYKLTQKYYPSFERQAAAFTRPELEYIESKPVVKVAYSANLYPLCYEKNGEFAGFGRMYFDLLGKKSGIEFEYVPVRRYEDGIAMLQSGEVSMLTRVMNSGQSIFGYELSMPYSQNNVMIVGKPDMILYSDTEVAVSADTLNITDLITQAFPYMKVTHYDTADQALKAARELPNCVTVNAMDTNSGMFYNDDSISALSILVTLPEQYPVCAAISDKAPTYLLPIINKSITQVTNEEMLALTVSYREQEGGNYDMETIIKLFGMQISMAAAAFVAIIAIIYFMIKLQKQKEINKMAFIDPITGGATLASFVLDAENMLARNSIKDYAVVSADMDNFKFINDVFGYDLGNELLMQTYAILKNDLVAGELVARVSADNYVMLVKHHGEENLRDRINAILSSVSALLHGEKYSTEIVMSCGVLLLQEDDSSNINALIDKAGIARKRIKGNHQSTFCFFDDIMRENILSQKLLEGKMGAALERRDFMLYLQPKFTLKDGRLCGAEALVRWYDQSSGGDSIIQPGDFIPLFEKNGFVVKLDFYMLRRACEAINARKRSGLTPMPISVNFSRLHLKNPNFVDGIASIVDECGVSHSLIEIELTESTMFDNEQKLSQVLNQLHEYGFLLSMDDFGSGYSSLGLLKNLPVDIIKLDKSFFMEYKDPRRATTVVTSIIEMAKKLNITTVAEGVETNEHVMLLRELGCDIGQGYFYSRPVPAEDFDSLF